MAGVRPTRVLIVDDSAIVRRMLSDTLAGEPDMEVVGVAADPYAAQDLIATHKPDVLTLDLEMPRMDGLTFLRQLMAHRPLPVIIVSSVTQAGSAASIEALSAGAIDVIAKPGGPYSVGEIADQLKYRIRALRAGLKVRFARLRPARTARVAVAPVSLAHASGVILLGASTGGTRALETILTRLPADTPPILIAQHMPAHFTRAFAARLDEACPMRVIEAAAGQPLTRGVAYVAPGNFHLTISARGHDLRTALGAGARVHYQRPSVDVLFHSATALRGVPVVAALLTGMGADGADGLLALRQAGAITIAEAEQSCVVFGMPAAAIERGAAAHVATLLEMPQLIAESLTRPRAAVQSPDRRVRGSDPARPVAVVKPPSSGRTH